ncbi:metallophosphoesterase [Candidatus Woesearchaeota archaeon]|nr:metallophosphoesterase [Candidatus Woesearchaeota archaeon]
MEILENIEIIDLALYLKKERILVIADLHIGFEEMLNKQGILIPRHQLKDIIDRLDKIFSKVKPRKIIINGDLKHEFGTISEQEWRDTLKVVDYLARKGKIILVKGNHDTILGPISKKRNIELVEKYRIGDVLVAHGDEIVEDKCKTLIIGHEHPAVTLKEDGREEKYKCFLKGKWKRKNLIVMPSMNTVTEGTDVVSDKLLSPYLQRDLSSFECFIVADRVYDFGKLKNLR